MPLPTIILPGYMARASEYQGLEQTLQALGVPAVTVPLQKRDWVATLTARSVTPVLHRIDQTVQQVLQQAGGDRVNLIGHSAGGWIARIYMGEHPYALPGRANRRTLWKAHAQIASLITLGTPHTSQERWTRESVAFVNDRYPGAFYPQVRYVCLAGKAIYGVRQWGSWLTYSSYQITCGRGDCWGDGITPVTSAHLEGAENLVLDGVWHAPRSPGQWYGSPDVVPHWLPYLT